MKILRCEFRNFGSYGNKLQVIEMPDKAGFSLVVGKNGHGKSTLSDVIKFGIFGKLETKKMKDIPNRLNKHTEIKIDLQTRRGLVTIERGLEPGYFRLFLDGKHIDKAGKRSVQDFLEEELLEMPFYVFSNTLSLSINDFKSFVKMSNFDKRAIIDKIFGLQILNKMRDLLKQQTKRLKDEIEQLGATATAFGKTLKSSEDELNNLAKRILESRGEKVELLKEQKIKLEEYIDRSHAKESEINSKIGKAKETKRAIDKSLSGELQYKKELTQQIKLYENSQCPVCASDLTTDFHKDNQKVIEENLTGCLKRIDALREHQTRIDGIYEKIDQAKNSVMKQLSSAETQLKGVNNELRIILENGSDVSEQTQSLKKIAEEAKMNIQQSGKNKFMSEKKVNFFSLVDEILGEKGIKQMAIRSILPSLNTEIQRLINMLGIEHRILFDEEFNSHISHFGIEVSPDTLSTGESKKVDFAVLLSIVKLMKLKYPGMNIIFLDEIFSSIDGDGIYHILKILRETVRDLELNTFVISHYPLTSTEFDYKIEIEKSKGFSSFTIEAVE